MTSPQNQDVNLSVFFDAALFEQQLTSDEQPIKVFKQALKSMCDNLDKAFQANTPIQQIIYGRSQILDMLLVKAWQLFDWPDTSKASLIAVGGYGRGELHPHSDIDILILFDRADPEEYQKSISGFLTFLWDIKLDIGSSVRTIDECFELSKTDITIATNLIESRTIIGASRLRLDMY
jgi:[protein-PII] uridylyltransferase